MTIENIAVILLFGGMLVIAIHGAVAYAVAGSTRFRKICLLPSDFYNAYSINWFGAILLYIVYFVFAPALAVYAFLKWLCTVGRKK